jgi:hypothetical protein
MGAPKRVKVGSKKSALDLAIKKKRRSEKTSNSLAGGSKSNNEINPSALDQRKVKVSPPLE